MLSNMDIERMAKIVTNNIVEWGRIRGIDVRVDAVTERRFRVTCIEMIHCSGYSGVQWESGLIGDFEIEYQHIDLQLKAIKKDLVDFLEFRTFVQETNLKTMNDTIELSAALFE